MIGLKSHKKKQISTQLYHNLKYLPFYYTKSWWAAFSFHRATGMHPSPQAST